MFNLKMVISNYLLPLGFEYKKNSWYRFFPEVHQVLNLQKSDYALKYYINLGLHPAEMVNDRYQSESSYGVRLRYNSDFFGTNLPKEIDLEGVVDESAIVEQVTRTLASCISFFDSVKNLAELKAVVQSNTYIRNRSTVALRKGLGLNG